MPNLNSDIKAEKVDSLEFFSSTIWWLDTLKRIENTAWGNAVDQKKKKPTLKFNAG